LNRIYESSKDCPLPLKIIALYLQNEVTKIYPNAKHSCVGGLIFLRFFCPAILAPDIFGLVDEVKNEARRGLVLISKIIQNVANGLEFGKKEPFMEELNPFINENIERAKKFFDEITNTNLETEILPLKSKEDVINFDLPQLHEKNSSKP